MDEIVDLESEIRFRTFIARVSRDGCWADGEAHAIVTRGAPKS